MLAHESLLICETNQAPEAWKLMADMLRCFVWYSLKSEFHASFFKFIDVKMLIDCDIVTLITVVQCSQVSSTTGSSTGSQRLKDFLKLCMTTGHAPRVTSSNNAR